MRDKLKAIYGKTTLSNREAMLALGLSRGRELGAILYTNELKSLSIDDIAEYLMKAKSSTLEQKYPDGTLSLSDGLIKVKYLSQRG